MRILVYIFCLVPGISFRLRNLKTANINCKSTRISEIALDQFLGNDMPVGMPRVLPPLKDEERRDNTFASDLVNLSTGKIYYATSPNGVSDWKIHPDSPVLLPSIAEGNWWWFDSTHCGVGDVCIPGQEAQSKFRIEGGMYLMYFFGGNQDKVLMKESDGSPVEIRGMKMEIGVAVSQDGIHWSRVEGDGPYGSIVEAGGKDDFDGQFVGWPNVIGVGSETRLYYNTYCPRKKKFIVGVASSRDGIRFRKLGPVFDGTDTPNKFDSVGASRRHVVRLKNGEFRMWYEGLSQNGVHSIGLATSNDGFRWDRFSDEPVFAPSSDPSAWDSGIVSSPHLVWLPEKERWRLYYVGSPIGNKNKYSMGIAESTDPDGIFFQRISRI